MEKSNQPYIINGGVYGDKTGQLSFVNDFSLEDITRFYIINQNINDEFKAWQGHKIEEKYFMCIYGNVNIYTIKIDNWSNPSKNLRPTKFELNSENPQVLFIPNGYANGLKALKDNTKTISFSKTKLKSSIKEKIKFDRNLWIKNQEI